MRVVEISVPGFKATLDGEVAVLYFKETHPVYLNRNELELVCRVWMLKRLGYGDILRGQRWMDGKLSMDFIDGIEVPEGYLYNILLVLYRLLGREMPLDLQKDMEGREKEFERLLEVTEYFDMQVVRTDVEFYRYGICSQVVACRDSHEARRFAELVTPLLRKLNILSPELKNEVK